MTTEKELSLFEDAHRYTSGDAKELLNQFKYSHLPPHLQKISKQFHDMACHMVLDNVVTSYSRTTGLRKLLEAKTVLLRCSV